jgi:pilus assembly protein Flp/PilA
MNKFVASVVEFLKEEDGPTAVEYAVMLALIVVACITTVRSVGDAASDKFDSVATTLEGATE